MKKSLVVALVLLTSFIAASAAQAQAQEPSTAEAIVQEWMQALEARSQELNRAYGLGEYSPAIRALKHRSQALNRQHGLGQSSPAQVKLEARAEPSTIDRIIAQERGRALDFGLTERPVLVVAAAEEGFDWSDAGVGGAVVLALALLATAALAFRPGRRHQSA